MKSFYELDEDADKLLSEPMFGGGGAPQSAAIPPTPSPPPLLNAPEEDDGAAVESALAQRLADWNEGGVPNGPSGPDLLYGRAKPPPRPEAEDALGYAQGADTLLRGGEAIQNQIRAAFGAKPQQFAKSSAADSLVRARIEQEKVRLRGEADKKAARAAALRDPNSPESKLLRSTYAKAAPQLVQQLGEQFDTLPGEFFGPGPEMLDMMEKRLAAGAAAQAKAAADAAKRAADQAEWDRRTAKTQGFQRAEGAKRDKSREKAAALSAGAKAGEKLQDETKDLEKRMPEGSGALISKMRALDEVIGGFDPENDADIPGVGSVAGRLPSFLLSEEGGKVRQLANGLSSALLKMQSGTAASEGEVARKMEELGMGGSSTERQFRQGLINLQKELASEIRQRQSGFSPNAVRTYEQRGGLSPDQVMSIGKGNHIDLGGSPPTGGFNKPAPDAVRVRDPNTGRTGWFPPNAIPAGAEVIDG